MTRRAKIVVSVLIVAVAVLANALLWVAAVGLRDAGETTAAQNAAAVQPARAQATTRVLRETMLLRCRLLASDATAVRWLATPVNASDAVVTSVHAGRGEEVESGSVLLTVSGRPVVVLDGQFPPYRDLRHGDQGMDVVQLQEALIVLGLRSEPASGLVDDATVEQVDILYEHLGHEPARRLGDVVLPRAEVVYADSLPRLVSDPLPPLGSFLGHGETLASLGGSRLQADCPLSETQASQLAVGMAAELELADGERAEATVDELHEPDFEAADTLGATMARRTRLRPNQPLSVTRIGQTALATVVVRGDETRLLAVPTSAIVRHSDGTSSVLVVGPDETTIEVAVRLGASAGGWVAVEADDGSVVEGTPVLLGN